MAIPAPGEPDEPKRGDSTDATPPTSTTPTRDAIWKSVLGATGGYGCERETYYREVVRDARGYRLSFGMDEPVIFGIAVDVLHGRLMERRHNVGAPDDPETARDDLAWALTSAMEAARGRETSAPWTDDDWSILEQRAGLAGEKLLGLWPNRTVDRRGESIPQPEPPGTPAGPPIGWLDPPEGVYIEPQRKLFAPDVVGGRGISGKPDYVFVMSVRDQRVIVGWVDVKALSRSGVYPAKWTGGEAVAYDYLCAIENGGVLPEWHGYLEYRRVQKPYWALIKAPVEPASIALAGAYFKRWGIALDNHEPDALSFNPKACAKCNYREVIPGMHGGCSIGIASIEVAPPSGDSED